MSLKTSVSLPFTGERYVPGKTGAQVSYEHLHRYLFARQFCKGKRVLDLGSGSGYGTDILAQNATSVVGLELDQRAIEFARKNCKSDHISFIQGSVTESPRDKDKHSFDVVVCFEVLEHIHQHDELITHAVESLKEDGLLILSTPNRRIYSDQQGNQNPFHVSELYKNELITLMSRYFPNTRLLGQRLSVQSEIWDEDAGGHMDFAIAQTDGTFTEDKKTLDYATYYLVLASQRPIDPAFSSSLTDLSDSLQSETTERIRALAGEREKYKHTVQKVLQEHAKLNKILDEHDKKYEATVATLQQDLARSEGRKQPTSLLKKLKKTIFG